jgi:hypothetical protein
MCSDTTQLRSVYSQPADSVWSSRGSWNIVTLSASFGRVCGKGGPQGAPGAGYLQSGEFRVPVFRGGAWGARTVCAERDRGTVLLGCILRYRAHLTACLKKEIVYVDPATRNRKSDKVGVSEPQSPSRRAPAGGAIMSEVAPRNLPRRCHRTGPRRDVRARPSASSRGCSI